MVASPRFFGVTGFAFPVVGSAPVPGDTDHPTLALCDDLVELLDATWAPAAPDEVLRDYFPRYGDGEAAEIQLTTGRKVVVLPADYDSAYATREEDVYTHRVLVVVLERYTDQGLPTRAWVDERADFVWEFVVKGFDFREPPAWNRFLRTVSIDVEVLDLTKIVSGGHLFESVVEFEFEETRSV